MDNSIICDRIRESIVEKQKILKDEAKICAIAEMSVEIVHALKAGGKLLICGNGGSAADSLHIAGEIVGRFQKERKAFSAISLNSDVATMTAIANDYGFEQVFSRQVEGLMTPRDVLLGISTSGNSKNVINAFEKAKEIGGKTMLLAGKGGGKLKDIADVSIIVPADVTARIQECHMVIYHTICELVEQGLL